MWKDTSGTSIQELEGIKPDFTLYAKENGSELFLPHLIGAFIELKKRGHIQDSDAKEQLFARTALYMAKFHKFFFVKSFFCHI